MTARFSLLFFLKRRGGYVGGDLPIYLRITVNGQRSELAIQRKCAPEKWCVKKGCMIGTREDVRELNAYILGIQTKVYEIHRCLVIANAQIDSDLIKQKLLGEDQNHRKFLTIFSDHNLEISRLIGKDYSKATLVKYATCLNSLKAFLNYKYQVDDIELQKLDYSFLKSFEVYLKTEQGVGHNTAMGYIKKVKKIAHLCVANKWLQSDPFTAFRISLERTSRLFLNHSELKALSEKKIDLRRLDEVRDMFLFSCYTGLAYVDVEKLNGQSLVHGNNGKLWIVIERSKTGVSAHIPLLPQALMILEKYKHHPKKVVSGKLLPLISNQKLNAYLKEISVICGIGKELSHHCARHTFATTVTLSNGVPLETVSKLLGHSSIKATQHYAKVLNTKVESDMDRLSLILD